MVIVGLDEVGRGCWAGPLVAGAVVLRRPIEGLDDSKQLTRRQREKLDEIIRGQASGFGLGWVGAAEVDGLGITESVRLAFTRALASMGTYYEQVIIDGNYNYLASDPRSRAIIRADATVPAVSAASIIAKVARDRFMMAADADYPGYGFGSHVGYGTKAHRAALLVQGVCLLHRRSFRPIAELLA